ncbi:MAG: FAD-dependent oxidoreductase [Microcella sp.]|uniref:protoporphyrinogen/coproporphyrinogen oxidase n=1 Tax=Microcella sp. TaxID=1913979 RepID=UPI0033161C5F
MNGSASEGAEAGDASPRDALVIGAGIAGLVAARELVLQGYTVRVLEADSVAGGQIRAQEIAGLRLDVGADSFATRDDVMRDYLGRLGLGERIVRRREATTWLHSAEDRCVRLPEMSLLGIPSAPLSADVVSITGTRHAWRGMLDAVMPGPWGARSATLGGLVRRRMGDGVLEKLVAPVVDDRHRRHPDELPVSAVPGLVHHLLRENSLSRAVTRLRLDAPAHGETASLAGGMTVLVDALLTELDRFGVSVLYGTRVAEVHEKGVVVATADPDRDGEHIAGRVIVAAPGLVGAGTRAAVHVVTLVLDGSGIEGAPRGSRVVVARGSSVRARALDHVSATWEWVREVAHDREVLRLTYESDVTAEQARADASRVMGTEVSSRSVLGSAVTTWHRADAVDATASIPMVGEQIAGPDLAAIIAHAQRTVRALS